MRVIKILIMLFGVFFSNTIISQDYVYFTYTNFYNTDYPLERDAIIQYDKEDNSLVYVELKNTTKFRENSHFVNNDPNNFMVDINKGDFFILNKNGSILFSGVYGFGNVVNVTDSVLFNWKLKDETKEIDGYQCYKALTDFRGRTWEAWYCPDIAINYGPWKFWGLPGLIFEVSDTEKIYNFHLTKIGRDLKQEIKYPEKHKKISLKEFVSNENKQGTIDNLDRDVHVETNFVRKSPELIYEWENENNE